SEGVSDNATFWKVLRPSVLSLLHDFNAILLQAQSKGMSEKELNELESQFWRLSTAHTHTVAKDRVQELLPPRVPFYQNLNDAILKNCRKRKQEIEVGQITTFPASGFLDNQLCTSNENRYEPRISWFRKTRDLSPSSWKPMLPSAKRPFDILQKKNLLNNENNATTSTNENDFTIPVEEYDLEFKNFNTNTIGQIFDRKMMALNK
uniref:Uncharacterized protein n=1 Tax=Romanomermis culicivorax TaxID=13658 RepID=A0A915KY34_ROMCU